MFGPIKAIVFDFDGTLVDTMSSVTRGLSAAVAVGRGEAVPLEELVKSFGAAPQDVLRKWMPPERVPIAFQHWLEFEKTLGPEEMKVFPEVPELLAGLKEKNIPITLFTGRDRGSALKIAKHHGWMGKYFDEAMIVCGDDGLPTKPHPAALHHLLKIFNLKAEETLMVGDHPHDMTAGRAAGCKTAAALWDLPGGMGTERSRFREAWSKWDGVGCDLRLVSPKSLLKWINGELGDLPSL